MAKRTAEGFMAKRVTLRLSPELAAMVEEVEDGKMSALLRGALLVLREIKQKQVAQGS